MAKKNWAEEKREKLEKEIKKEISEILLRNTKSTKRNKVKEAKRFIKDLIKQKQKEAYVEGYKEAVQGLKSVRERKPIKEIDLDKASVEELKAIKQKLIERIEDE